MEYDLDEIRAIVIEEMRKEREKVKRNMHAFNYGLFSAVCEETKRTPFNETKKDVYNEVSDIINNLALRNNRHPRFIYNIIIRMIVDGTFKKFV